MTGNLKLWAAALAAVMALCPLNAWAQETAPLAATQAQEESSGAREKLAVFGKKRTYLGVNCPTVWMKQARLDYAMLELRLFTPEGEQITFQQNVSAASTGGKDICLSLRASSREMELLLQLDQAAVDLLTEMNVTEIVVADMDLYVQAIYLTKDLAALRTAFALGKGEMLCVSGEENPVTAVGLDGVRRQLTP